MYAVKICKARGHAGTHSQSENPISTSCAKNPGPTRARRCGACEAEGAGAGAGACEGNAVRLAIGFELQRELRWTAGGQSSLMGAAYISKFSYVTKFSIVVIRLARLKRERVPKP